MLDTLAHAPDPYPTYAALRNKGVHQHDDGRWVVASAADVEAVLASPAAIVGFTPAADDAVQSRMSRFSDGEAHSRRRAIATSHLAHVAPEDLRSTARDLTTERLQGERGADVMAEVARDVPATALATALGFPDPAAAYEEAQGLDEVAVNVMALLFQAKDATAGLIGNAVLANARFGTPLSVEALVRETNRFDPPVQLTTRVAAAPVDVAGTTIPEGGRIVVLLAAANRDPARYDRPDEFDPARSGPAALTFGAGRRPCPGDEHALALATGVLEALDELHATADEEHPIYEPRPNLRIPARLVVRLG